MIQHLEITADLTITTLMAMNHLKHEKEVHSLTR